MKLPITEDILSSLLLLSFYDCPDSLKHWASLTFRKEPFDALRSKYFRVRKYHARPQEYHKLEHEKDMQSEAKLGWQHTHTHQNRNAIAQGSIKRPIPKRKQSLEPHFSGVRLAVLATSESLPGLSMFPYLTIKIQPYRQS